MDSNSKLKLKIVKTDELLGLYAAQEKKLKETKQLYKTLKTKYKNNVSELQRVTIEYERVAVKLFESDKNTFELIKKLDSVRADHASLEKKYSDLVIEGQLNLRTNQVYIDLNKQIEDLKKAKRSCKVDDEGFKNLKGEYERLLNDFAEKQSELAKLRGVLEGYDERLGELEVESFDVLVQEFVGLQEENYRVVLEKQGLVEELGRVREEIEVWRSNEQTYLEVINKRVSTVSVQTESDKCCVHSMLFNVRAPDMISPMLSDMSDVEEPQNISLDDKKPEIHNKTDNEIPEEKLENKPEPNIKIIQQKPINRKMQLSRFHNYNEFKIRNLFLKKGKRKKGQRTKENAKPADLIYETMMELNRHNMGFTITNLNNVAAPFGYCVNCRCGDKVVKCEAKNRDLEKLSCGIDECKCQSYMVIEGDNLLGFIDIKKEKKTVNKETSKSNMTAEPVSQTQTKESIVNTEENDLQITENVVQLSIPDTSDIDDDFDIDSYVFPPPPLSPIASICGDGNPAISPLKSPARLAISPLKSPPRQAISPQIPAISPLKSPQPCDISNKPKKIQILQNVVLKPPSSQKSTALKRTFSSENEESRPAKKQNLEEKTQSMSKTSQLFKKLISFPREIKVAEEVLEYLSTQDPLYVSQLILEVTSQDTLDLSSSNRPPNCPLLTETQMVLMGLMLKYEKKTGKTILNHFLNQAELRLFTDPSVEQKILNPICRMYFAICKMNFDLDRVRRFCCEAFYFMGSLAVPILFNLLTTWMEVLPHYSNCKEHPMARVLVYLVLTRTCPKVGYNLLPLIGLLTGHYGYPRDREDRDTLFKDVFKCYVRKPNKLSSLTILLLCKDEPADWLIKKVDSQFKPLVYKVQSDNFKATVLVLLGKMFKSISDVSVLKETRLWLESLLEDNSEERGSVLIKRAVEYCIRHFPTENA